jgi:hypothetical protein
MKDPFHHNFGLWSARDILRVSELLDSLGVRFQIDEEEASQDVLEDWCAWDPTAQNPNVGYQLWIHHDDVEKVGYHIVTMFPERKFGAP